MSKSTSTVTGLSCRRDENKNPAGIGNQKLPSTPPTLSNRNVDFKDISNSTLLPNKLTGDSDNVKKKLIIPLEPDLTENEEYIHIEPIGHSSPVVEKTVKVINKASGRLSRKQKNKKREYAESPQCSLMKWAKPMKSMQDDSDNLNDNLNNSACGSRALDNDDEVGDDKKLPRRNCRAKRKSKRVRDPDYLYEDLKKKVSRKLNSSENSDEAVEQSEADSEAENEADESCEESESEVFQSRKRQRLHSSPQNDKLKKTVVNNTKGTLKSSKMPLRLTKAGRRKQKAVTQAKPATRTLNDFFSQKVAEEDLNLTQEEKDRKLAEELQKQFELEAKFHLNSIRFKGTTEQYSLRTSRRKTTLEDYV